MNNYNNACTEVITILNYLEKEDYKKIPMDLIQALEHNKNNNYKFEFDWEISIKEQNLMRETKAILFNIFRDYLATKEQKQIIIQMQQNEREKKDKEKRKLYNNNVFAKKNRESKIVAEKSLANIQKDNGIKIIFNKIISFFKATN